MLLDSPPVVPIRVLSGFHHRWGHWQKSSFRTLESSSPFAGAEMYHSLSHVAQDNSLNNIQITNVIFQSVFAFVDFFKSISY